MDVLEGRIRADGLDIEFNQAPLPSHEPQRVKLYNMATLPQKIQLWLILGLSLGSLITNLTFIASSFTYFLNQIQPSNVHRGSKQDLPRPKGPWLLRWS